MKFAMPVLEFLFELIFEFVFELFLELFQFEKLMLAICNPASRLARWALRGRKGTVYFQTRKSCREPARRATIFSPTRRGGRRRRSSYEVG